MRRHVAMVLLAAVLAAMFAADALAAAPPADRVIAIYFHRTERCPTCKTMGSYAEEAVKQGFVKQVEQGSVEFHYVDFQNKKNAALAEGYKVTGPALIVVKVAGGKAQQYKDLTDIWAKVGDKPDFIRYVRENVEAYLP